VRLPSHFPEACLTFFLAAGCGRGTPSSPPSENVKPASHSCDTCHAEIAGEWKDSFHRVSFTDRTFQASLALEEPEEHAFCIGCHAPAGDRTAGVDCASCHGADPHAKKLAAVDTCRNCHEFRFAARAELVQKTVSEHTASDFAGVSCTACHMPSRGGHRDHRFLAGHAPERLAGAVHVEATRASARALHVSVRVDAGHAFPTGDMFRRARLAVFAEDTEGHIVASAERTFGRTWTALPDGARTEATDTRIRGAWAEDVALDEPSAPVARVRWSLHYERVVSMRPPHISLASSDILAEGEVAWK